MLPVQLLPDRPGDLRLRHLASQAACESFQRPEVSQLLAELHCNLQYIADCDIWQGGLAVAESNASLRCPFLSHQSPTQAQLPTANWVPFPRMSRQSVHDLKSLVRSFHSLIAVETVEEERVRAIVRGGRRRSDHPVLRVVRHHRLPPRPRSDRRQHARGPRRAAAHRRDDRRRDLPAQGPRAAPDEAGGLPRAARAGGEDDAHAAPRSSSPASRSTCRATSTRSRCASS